MTKRPDQTDLAQARDRAAARHHRCLCGDGPRCTCGTPSQGWRPWSWRPLMGLVFGYLQMVDRKQDEILKEIKNMGSLTSAALAHLADKVHRFVDAYNAVVAERDAFKAALESADADKAAAVQAALDADDAVDSAAIGEAEALIPELTDAVDNPPADEPPADEPPAEDA